MQQSSGLASGREAALGRQCGALCCSGMRSAWCCLVCCACTWVRLWQAPCRCRRCSLRQARAAQNEVPVTQQIELASMPLDDSYDGPRMEGARRAGCLPCRGPNACLCAFQRGPADHLRAAAEPAAPREPTL